MELGDFCLVVGLCVSMMDGIYVMCLVARTIVKNVYLNCGNGPFLIWNIINSSPSKVHDDMEWSSSSYSMSKYFLATLAVWIISSVHHSDSDLDVSITIGSTDMKFSYRYSWFPDDHSYWLQGSFLASCANMRLIFVIFSRIDLQ